MTDAGAASPASELQGTLDERQAAITPAFDNPTPHTLHSYGKTESPNPVLFDTVPTLTDKLVVVMVGLPARGKTRISRRIMKYLAFFHGVCCKMVNVADYRRAHCGLFQPAEFYDVHNDSAQEQLHECRELALNEVREFLMEGHDTAKVCFLDGTNASRKYRRYILERLHGLGTHVLFMECICTDQAQVERNMRDIHEHTPDYHGFPVEKTLEDLRNRTGYIEAEYEGMDTDGSEGHLQWIRVSDMRRYEINNVHGYLQGRITQLVMNLQPGPQHFYLSRHGQSEYNELGKIGGDAGLTAEGRTYAAKLAEYAEKVICRDAECKPIPCRLWTSTLRRTIETGAFIRHPTMVMNTPLTLGDTEWVQMKPRRWPNLDEIYAGVCDGMTYEEIKANMPVEFELRSRDKLGYRYPRGESYLDVCHRLEPVVMEMERLREPLLVIAHQGILRLIYAYFMGLPREEAPYVSIPLNTVIHLEPETYSCKEQRELLHTKHAMNSDGQAEPDHKAASKRLSLSTHDKCEDLSFHSYNIAPPPRMDPNSPARGDARLARSHKVSDASKELPATLVREDSDYNVNYALEPWEDDPPSH